LGTCTETAESQRGRVRFWDRPRGDNAGSITASSTDLASSSSDQGSLDSRACLWQTISSSPSLTSSASRLADGRTKLDRSIGRYRCYLEATAGESPRNLNFEDLETHLDHEHLLGLRGSDSWSDEGNEDQLMLRWGIGAILNRMTPRQDKIPELYVDFAQRLRAGDVVVTFNYDRILERSLEAAGVPYRRFACR
jgi:hypothetical protein